MRAIQPCTHELLTLCRDDLVNMQLEALKNPEFRGVYNATAPNPVRMAELCASLGSVLGRPSWLPVPEFAIQAGLTTACPVHHRSIQEPENQTPYIYSPGTRGSHLSYLQFNPK